MYVFLCVVCLYENLCRMPSHPKQSISINNKQNSSVLKIKQKNKRRNRKKRKQKAQYPIIIEMSNIATMTSKYSVDNATDASNTTRNQMAVAQMWAKSYETMIRLQFQHRIQYWKNLAIYRNTEIRKLRKNLLRQQNLNNCKNFEEVNSPESETGMKANNQEDLVSESYLKFLEITLRHRQERKHKRNDNNDEKTDSD